MLKKERVNNQNCSGFYAPAIKCSTVSIIHMWVHVIYLQLNYSLLSSWSPGTADTRQMRSVSSLWTPAVLKQNDDHTISITYSRTSFWPDAQEAALPAPSLAASSDARRLETGPLWLHLTPGQPQIHTETSTEHYSPGFTPM